MAVRMLSTMITWWRW